MKYYAWYYRAEAGKLSAQNRIVKILGFGGQMVPAQPPLPLYRKSSHREIVNREVWLGSHRVLFTETGRQRYFADTGSQI